MAVLGMRVTFGWIPTKNSTTVLFDTDGTSSSTTINYGDSTVDNATIHPEDFYSEDPASVKITLHAYQDFGHY